MNISQPFITRPVATTLLTLAVAISGIIAFHVLPVSPLPQMDFPTISVSASLPGASPETMASAVATPLERQFGRIAGITEMTSASYLGTCSITLQFDLNRSIDAAARDVQAAINAARGYLPANLPTTPPIAKSIRPTRPSSCWPSPPTFWTAARCTTRHLRSWRRSSRKSAAWARSSSAAAPCRGCAWS